jgi:serine/threonine-protein kinase
MGSRIGPYEIVEFCAAGGRGEVYRPREAQLNRDVALKVLSPGYLHDPERRARFRREARLLAALDHPDIAAIHGLEEASGITALVMEFVDGPTLDRLIADTLEAAHDHGIVHRDLKSDSASRNSGPVASVGPLHGIERRPSVAGNRARE